MKKFLKEFKEFFSKGNVIDMAIGLIIGSAFTSIVSSVVADLFTPILGLLIPEGGFSELNDVGPGFNFGNLINAIITFFITAFCLFLIVKGINTLKSLTKKDSATVEPEAPVTKICPKCMSEIHIAAVKCPCCTSDLDK